MSLGAISLLFLLPVCCWFYAVFRTLANRADHLVFAVRLEWHRRKHFRRTRQLQDSVHRSRPLWFDPALVLSDHLLLHHSDHVGLIIAVLVKDMKSKMGRGFAQVCLFLPRVIPGAAGGRGMDLDARR